MKRILTTLAITIVPVAGLAHGAHPHMPEAVHGLGHAGVLLALGAIALAAGVALEGRRRVRS